MTEKQPPYVVSEDIKILLGDWCAKTGFTLPTDFTFRDVRRNFSFGSMPGRLEMVPEQELQQGMRRIVERTGLLPVSLDRVYYPTNPGIDLTRTVGFEGEDRGLEPRFGSKPLDQQIEDIKQTDAREIVLIDDVIFSGGLASRMIDLLDQNGIRTAFVCAGIAIGEGVDRLRQKGIETSSVRYYEEVIDQVCERDFYPGVPFSGRTFSRTLDWVWPYDMGLAYIMPDGNPVQWASIPEEQSARFSRECLERTENLYRAIEACSGQPIAVKDLDRRPAFMRSVPGAFSYARALKVTREDGRPFTRP